MRREGVHVLRTRRSTRWSTRSRSRTLREDTEIGETTKITREIPTIETWSRTTTTIKITKQRPTTITTIMKTMEEKTNTGW